MNINTKFQGMYVIGNSIATKNLIPGNRVYGEKLVNKEGIEYRLWNPRRSKLAAAILKGLTNIPFKYNSKILYLGASSGTTVSHISDFAPSGMIFCVEFSPRAFLKLLYLSNQRKNMYPFLCDANKPRTYRFYMEKCDIIYQDLAQPNQAEILCKNSEYFLKNSGHIAIAIKARSINVAKNPQKIFKEEIKKIKDYGFKILETVNLHPYERDHILVIGKKSS